MNIQVLDIQPCLEGHLFDVQVRGEKEPDVFKVKVQEDKMDLPIQVASADRYSRQKMQHDARLMSQIDRLVLKVYNGEEVLLPLTITEHSRLWATGSRQVRAHNRSSCQRIRSGITARILKSQAASESQLLVASKKSTHLTA